MHQNELTQRKLIRWPRLVVGAITLLFAGIIYAWSILKAPFVTEFGWTPTQLGLNYTFTICFFCIGGFISGLISKKTTPRIRLLSAAVLMLSGFVISSRLDADKIILLYLSYGIIMGAGVGFVYNTVIGITNMWYPDKKGLCSGVLLTGFGLTSLLIGKLADAMMKMETIGWRTTFMCLGGAIGVVLIIASFLVTTPPEGIVFPAPKESGHKRFEGEGVDYTSREMLKRPSFYFIFTFIVLLSAVGSAAISFAKDIVVDVGATTGFAVTMVGVISVFNGLGRLISGGLLDRIGMLKTKYITGTVTIIAPLTVVLALTADSLAAGVTGLCLCGFALGFAPTMSSVFTISFYGRKNFVLNFGIMNLVLIPASFAATLAGNIKDSTGSFITAFIILTACSIVGMGLILAIRKP